MIEKSLSCRIAEHRSLCLAVTFAAIAVLDVSCVSTSHLVREADLARFDARCRSQALRDSIRNGKLVTGMPYFVVSQVFSNWDAPRGTLVPCVGSRQAVEDFEGWGRRFSCPDLNIYLDEYETSSGNIAIWYQCPDFYRMGVSVGDTLFLVSKNRAVSSVIQSILNATKIRLKEKLPGLAEEDTLYGEIHYADNPKRPSGVSYWYLLGILSDDRTVTLSPLSFEFYPIEQIEHNGEPVFSIRWRGLQ